MSGKRFVDTNVLLYALMEGDNEKSLRAKSVLTGSDQIISIQVINELAFNLLKKSNINESVLSDIIKSLFEDFEVVVIDKQIVLHASELRQKFSFSFWDSLIVSSAIKSGCDILFSEDMQHGLTIYKQMQIVNPFI